MRSPLDAITLVAGIDNTYVTEDGKTTAGAVVVVLTFPEMEVVETAFAWQPIAFPYVPGLLSFREAPAVLAAYADLTVEPDVVLCDGQGYAHPRRFGLASHLGVLLDRPTIGCAKSRLIGEYEEPERVFGANTPLVDRGEVVGAAVRTRPRHKPLFVSPGHKISVETAVADHPRLLPRRRVPAGTDAASARTGDAGASRPDRSAWIGEEPPIPWTAALARSWSPARRHP